jgi:manganese/zinc/iron transport system substrate-binding protein
MALIGQRIRISPVFLAVVLVGLAGCDRGQSADEAGGRLNVVCTIGMITDVATIIAADRADVVGLMGEGVDPHLYKASPRDVRLLSDADLVLYNGLHLEGKMTDLFERMADQRPVVAVTDRIDRDRLRQPPQFEGHYDPHVWFDVSLWMQAAQRIRDALIEVDPDGREVYEHNADAFVQQLGGLDEEVRQAIAGIPKARRVLITAHDAFGYFGQAYDIDVMGLQGISTESEPSLKDVNHLVDLIVERGVRAVFVESSVPPKNLRALVEGCRARGHEIVIGGELFSDAMGAAGTEQGTYLGMVRHNVETIVGALQ